MCLFLFDRVSHLSGSRLLLILVVVDEDPHHLTGVLPLGGCEVEVGRFGHVAVLRGLTSLLVVHSVAVGSRAGGVVGSVARGIVSGALGSAVLGVVLGTGPLHLRLLLLLLLVHWPGQRVGPIGVGGPISAASVVRGAGMHLAVSVVTITVHSIGTVNLVVLRLVWRMRHL